MNVLVTGGYGLVGHSLQKFAQLETKYNFTFISRTHCDLRNYNDVISLFAVLKPDIVVHLASYVGGVYENNNNNNYAFLMDNMKINMNIIEACKKYKISKLINMLSTCIFPDTSSPTYPSSRSTRLTYPLTTDQMFNGLPHHSNIGYSYSKRMLYIMSKILADTTRTKVVNIIPTNLYGLYDNYNLVSGHVIPAMIHNIYKSINDKTDIVIKGTGKAIRQFLFVDDLSKIILYFVDDNILDNFTEIIASPPESHQISIKDLCNKMCSIFDTELLVSYNSNYIDGQYKKTTSDVDILKHIPTFVFTSLDDGLKKVINNFNENFLLILKK